LFCSPHDANLIGSGSFRCTLQSHFPSLSRVSSPLMGSHESHVPATPLRHRPWLIRLVVILLRGGIHLFLQTMYRQYPTITNTHHQTRQSSCLGAFSMYYLLCHNSISIYSNCRGEECIRNSLVCQKKATSHHNPSDWNEYVFSSWRAGRPSAEELTI
jgi:hypothetical protein